MKDVGTKLTGHTEEENFNFKITTTAEETQGGARPTYQGESTEDRNKKLGSKDRTTKLSKADRDERKNDSKMKIKVRQSTINNQS
jgi:hypothetical protein